ncbi:exopolysaccharide biosynthesis polyprenyl glycosylphosphotransferase [soil metagenome]
MAAGDLRHIRSKVLSGHRNPLASSVSEQADPVSGRSKTSTFVRANRSRVPRPGFDVVPLVLAIDAVALISTAAATSLSAISSGLMLVLILCFNAVGGHYRPRLAPSMLDEVPSLAGRALVAGAIVTAIRILLDLPVKDGPVSVAVLFVVVACLGRAIGYPLMRRSRVVGRAARPTIIVGCGRVGDQLARTLLEHPEYGLKPVGYIDDRPFIPAEDHLVPLLGGTDALADTLIDHQVRNVIVAFSSSPESVIVDVLRTCDRLACEIFLVPRFYELHGASRDNELVWGLPLIRLRRAAYRTLTWRCKRGIDAGLALISLVVFSPLLAMCAFAVRFEGGRGVIFRQERVGLDGRPFTMLKFRSLKPSDEVESTSHWNIGGDPRMGPVGRFLRSTSLDELPQLWNVLRGDMSLVGPRPERPFFVREFTKQFPRYMARHRVPAGVTGWAQINGLRGDTDISDRARFDNYYIENWSLWEDVKIVLRTSAQILGARGR